MLRKLLKYDLAFVWRWWRIIAVIMVVASLLGALLLRGTLAATDGVQETLIIICVLYFIPYLLAIVACTAATPLLLYWRFYSHFYSDQGYLTFTLPVKRRTLLLSKVYNELIWHVAQGLLLIFCICLICLIAPPATQEYPVINPVAFQFIGELFSLLGAMFGLITAIVVLEIVLAILVSTLFQICLVHFCITIGAVIAKKMKLLAGIGIYYAVNAALSVAGQVLFGIAGGLMLPGFAAILVGCTKNEGLAFLMLFGLLFIAIFAAFSVLLYCLTQDKLDRKLNLA